MQCATRRQDINRKTRTVKKHAGRLAFGFAERFDRRKQRPHVDITSRTVTMNGIGHLSVTEKVKLMKEADRIFHSVKKR